MLMEIAHAGTNCHDPSITHLCYLRAGMPVFAKIVFQLWSFFYGTVYEQL